MLKFVSWSALVLLDTADAAARDSPPALGQWNGTRWLAARESESPAVVEAVRAVRVVADAQLRLGPFSVTFAPAAGFVPGTTKHDFVTTPAYYWDCRTQCTKDLLGPGSNTNCSMWCGPWNENCNWTQANRDDWLPLDTGCDQQTGLPWRSRARISALQQRVCL